MEPVWSTSSEKGDGRALRSRMARLFEGLLLSNFRTIGSLVKPRRVRGSMVMVMVIYSALVRSHQSTYEGSFGPVPHPEQT